MSFRRVFSTVFIFALAFLDLSACGRQVTPERLTTVLAQHMVIRFRTKNPMNFSTVTYAIVFDTCTPGGEPYPNAFTTGYANYSYAFVIGGSGVVTPILYQYILTSGSVNPIQVTSIQPASIQFVPSSNGLGTEFSLTFPRTLLSNPLGVLPLVNGGCSSPAVSTSTWFINFFTIDPTGNRVVDSLGLGGSSDTSYVGLYDTTTLIQSQITRAPGSTLPTTPAAQIDGGEVDNYP
jgi:hypothetical protein